MVRPGVGDATSSQDDELVGQRRGETCPVRHQHHPASRFPYLPDASFESGGTVCIQTGERFIEEQQLRIVERGSGDRQPLRHTPRKLTHRSMGVGSEPHAVQADVGPFLTPIQTMQRSEEQQILASTEVPV